MSLAFAPLSDLRNKIDSGEISAVDLMNDTLDRIDATNPTINAVVSLRNRDDLLAEAAKPIAGPLSGIPIAIKDLSDTANLKTTYGSPILANNIPNNDAGFVARIRAVGAIIIGKTNTPEFGLGSHTYNPVFGATKNPFDTSKTAGGSSGGAAAALAMGYFPVADGSDMMGSLRNPAGYCNVYGFRPSFGRVPGDDVGDQYLHSLATSGPMARNIADLTSLLDIMSAPSIGPFHPQFSDGPFSGQLDAGIANPRIGWLGDWGGAYQCQPGVLDLCETGLKTLESLGAKIDPIAPPVSSNSIWQSWIDLRSFQLLANFKPLYDNPDHRKKLKPAVIWEVENALSLNASKIHAASEARTNWYRAAMELFETYDFLALPTAQMFPFDVDIDFLTKINNQPMDTYHRWMECVVPVSLLGLPALNVPCGFDELGRPMGMQIIAKPGADLAALQLGHRYHQATDWPNKRRP